VELRARAAVPAPRLTFFGAGGSQSGSDDTSTRGAGDAGGAAVGDDAALLTSLAALWASDEERLERRRRSSAAGRGSSRASSGPCSSSASEDGAPPPGAPLSPGELQLLKILLEGGPGSEGESACSSGGGCDAAAPASPAVHRFVGRPRLRAKRHGGGAAEAAACADAAGLAHEESEAESEGMQQDCPATGLHPCTPQHLSAMGCRARAHTHNTCGACCAAAAAAAARQASWSPRGCQQVHPAQLLGGSFFGGCGQHPAMQDEEDSLMPGDVIGDCNADGTDAGAAAGGA
jgi:hypothetical protein